MMKGNRVKRRKNKSYKKSIIKELDGLCRKIVYIRDGGKCKRCHKTVSGKNAHTSHVIPKSKSSLLRHDLINLDLMCLYCHINWWHKNPIEAAKWFHATFHKRWEYLQLRKNEMVKITLDDMMVKRSLLTDLLKQMEEDE